jgi:hypothetical protein
LINKIINEIDTISNFEKIKIIIEISHNSDDCARRIIELIKNEIKFSNTFELIKKRNV